MPKGCVNQMGGGDRQNVPPLLRSRAIRTEAATGEGAWIARVQEMPQDGEEVQRRQLLGTSMQQQHPQVMQTSPLEGYLATALSTAIAFSATAAVLPCATR